MSAPPPKPQPASNLAIDAVCALLALAAGAAAWVVPARISGHKEAWDGDLWWAWLGASVIAAGVLGFAGSRRWWLWPLLIMASQFVAMGVRSVEPFGGLAVTGMGFMGAVAGALMIPAFIGAKLRRGFVSDKR